MEPFYHCGNYKPGLLFADGPKWKNGTTIHEQSEYHKFNYFSFTLTCAW